MQLTNTVTDMQNDLKESVSNIMSLPITLGERYEKIVQKSSEMLEQINISLTTTDFENDQQEINFFKVTLPPIYATYIRYVTTYQIETQKPIGIKKALERHFKKELKKIEEYTTQHSELYRYIKSGKKHLDNLYFLRTKSINDFSIDNYFPAINKRCCTIYTLRIATLQANETVKDYLYQALDEVKNNFAVVNKIAEISPLTQLKKLVWTDSKTNLIELAYALQSAGCFNEGKAQLTQIISYLEHIFSVNLGNTTRIFQDILARKTGYTKFIEQLRDRLLTRINKIEDKNMR